MRKWTQRSLASHSSAGVDPVTTEARGLLKEPEPYLCPEARSGFWKEESDKGSPRPPVSKGRAGLLLAFGQHRECFQMSPGTKLTKL